MVIIVKNLMRPDSSRLGSLKLSELGGKVAENVRKRSNNKYIATSTTTGGQLKIILKVKNPDTNVYQRSTRDEQNKLAKDLSIFLRTNRIMGDVIVQ